jgi:hypothetical protein
VQEVHFTVILDLINKTSKSSNFHFNDTKIKKFITSLSLEKKKHKVFSNYSIDFFQKIAESCCFLFTCFIF